MARVHKVEFYLVDANDYYIDGYDLITEITNDLEEGFVKCLTWKTSKEFEWDDNIKLNYINCTKEDCEEYFKL